MSNINEKKQQVNEVILTTYSQSMHGHSAYSYLIRADKEEKIESKLLENCDNPGKAELMAILAALRSLSSASLVLLFPYHTSYLSQEFSNLENGIKHINKPNLTDIFDELAPLLKYHDVLIEYSKEIRSEAGLLQEATFAILSEFT
ncbi:MAG: hypothetical protein K0S27_258 [Gammaproteobacteria bacterium]|jgi:ribonuclease HI|nr:hypothetical protein [Gammaproteobacteria bacterium]